MKHIKKFNNEQSLINYKKDNNCYYPNILLDTSQKQISYNSVFPEYIKSSGSNYIELENLSEYIEYNEYVTVKYKMMLEGNGYDNSSQPALIGDSTSRNLIVRGTDKVSANTLECRFFTQNTSDTVKNIAKINEIIEYNNTWRSTLDNNITTNSKVYLFAGYNDNGIIKRLGIGRLYYLQFIKNDELILDLIPIYFNKDKYGVYDKIKNKFYSFINIEY